MYAHIIFSRASKNSLPVFRYTKISANVTVCVCIIIFVVTGGSFLFYYYLVQFFSPIRISRIFIYIIFANKCCFFSRNLHYGPPYNFQEIYDVVKPPGVL